MIGISRPTTFRIRQKAFAEQSYKVKFMNEPDINTHLRITLGRPEQNRIVIDTIKEIASK